MNWIQQPIFAKKGKGQSFVELALLFPVLLILVSGMVEFGFLLNQYLAIIDAARNAARFSSDSLYYNRDGNTNCDQKLGTVTTDFYFQTACVVNQELYQEKPTIVIDTTRGDDIVVSAFTITGGASPHVSRRHPVSNGWSYAEALTGSRQQSSAFSTEDVNEMLQSGAPSTGVLIVEVYYHYDQILALPWITAFLPNPLLLHGYTFMPLVSAEPTATPLP
jgi:hypothetical protein